MNRRLAEFLVFLASAAVLVIEIAAVRLMAPYVGQTLETFTAIISTVLAGIAAGTAVGGRLADTHDPGTLIRVELVGGGILTLLLVPLVRAIGPTLGGGLAGLVALTVLTVFVPAAVLSAISPAIIKANLVRLAETGTTVGRFSAIGTVGAIAGSVTTGFVLLARFSTSSILLWLGAGLAALGIGLSVRRNPRVAIVAAASVALGSVVAASSEGPCDAETRYYCVRLVPDAGRPGATYLVLDDLFHSHVDPADPTHLEFSYTRMFGTLIDATSTGALEAVHIGGGGFTMPRWIEATRPGSRSRVLELDPDIVELDVERLGLSLDSGIGVTIGDARRTLAGIGDGEADLVIGDAFGGRAVPWHLTTRQFHLEVERVLASDGTYVVNLIDGPDMAFVRSMTRTLLSIWSEVSVLTVDDRLIRGGNVVLAASHSPFDTARLVELGGGRGLRLSVLSGGEARSFAGEGVVLTDDFAPVDQLLSPHL